MHLRRWAAGALIVFPLIFVGLAHIDALPVKKQQVVVIDRIAPCNLDTSDCFTILADNQQIELIVSQRPIPLLKPFKLTVKSKGVSPERIEVSFQGKNMDMALLPIPFTANQDGSFSAEAIIPMCIAKSMEWLATVTIQTKSQVLALPYTFSTTPEFNK